MIPRSTVFESSGITLVFILERSFSGHWLFTAERVLFATPIGMQKTSNLEYFLWQIPFMMALDELYAMLVDGYARLQKWSYFPPDAPI